LQGQIDGVLVCVPSTQAEAVMREAVQIGLKNIWLQQGAESPEVLAAAQGLGVMPVSGKCILMYAQPVRSFHAFHRVIAKVFGQLE
jgi:predicted CoA-binding protein